MNPPEDQVFYIEHLYDGMTSVQRWEKELSESRWTYLGKARYIEEVRKPRIHYTLDGPPELPQPLLSVELTEFDRYVQVDNSHLFCSSSRKVLQTWTFIEWADLLHEKNITPDKLQEFKNSLCKVKETPDAP